VRTLHEEVKKQSGDLVPLSAEILRKGLELLGIDVRESM
jgi:arginyl-tRNA synthetase